MAHEDDYNDQADDNAGPPTGTGEMSYDDFLKYTGRSSGGGFLKDWKDEGQIDVWLPPMLAPQPRWQHRFIHIQDAKPKDAKDGDAKVPTIMQFRWNCIEREAILRKYRFRFDDGGAFAMNGTREHPPEDCPWDLFIEWVRTEIRQGRLDWMDPLFKLETDDDERIIRAGGFVGLTRTPKEKLTGAQREDMRRNDVDQSEEYKSDGRPALDYLVRCVEYNDPQGGILKTSVGDTLGQLIQNEIRNRITVTAKSRRPFDPRRDWLCLRWIYNDAKSFKEKYAIMTMTEEEPTREVLETLKDVPSIQDDIRKGDPRELLEKFQAAIVPGIKVPWDELFGPAIERANKADPFPTTKGTSQAKQQRQTQKTEVQKPKDQTPPKGQQKPQHAPENQTFNEAMNAKPDDDDGMVACDVCEKPMPETEFECPHCRSRFDPRTFKVVFNGPEEAKKEAERKAAEEAAKGKGDSSDSTPQPRAPARRRSQQAR